jgi:hypothetical protein
MRKGNKKELWFDAQFKAMIKFSMKYYRVDETTSIKLLMRIGFIELMTKVQRDKVPVLSDEMLQLIEKAEL